MKQVLLVFAGGGLGSVCRYLLNKLYLLLQIHSAWATFTANLLSCLLIGLILGIELMRQDMDQAWKLLLITGFCGGLSTYSTFSLETINLYKQASLGWAFLNLAGTFICCTAAIFMGIHLIKLLNN